MTAASQFSPLMSWPQSRAFRKLLCALRFTTLAVAYLLMPALFVTAPACAEGPAHPEGAPLDATDPAIAAAVDGSWRTQKARARDAFRHPVEVLGLLGAQAGHDDRRG